ncbi:hypothetical protein [Candidatus Electronema sp. JC]|uniref:hypothetical protein n=1 Tax=Candidatus Electronema sp. JC TaxID=3401570 RepID=UPI003B42DD71
MLMLAGAILLWGIFDQSDHSLFGKVIALYAKKQLYIAFAVLALQAIASYLIIKYVADAARYLTPSPDNIAERNKIRAEGIKLLRSLHESGKYFRIVVVGHSLGSVIGYDIIRHLWVDLRESYDPHPIKQPLAAQFDRMTAPTATIEVEAFQQKQHKLWREHRAAGIPWLVTDFITIGSPLTHATLLMADDFDKFEECKVEFEYPCCPPVSIKEQDTHYRKNYIFADSHIVSVLIPHHGAPFASTRWTNLFFPYRMGIFGDLIGGPLAGSFGYGIRDVPVCPSDTGFLGKLFFSHTRYWDSSEADSIKALRSAMRLESLHSKEAWPEPTQLTRKP